MKRIAKRTVFLWLLLGAFLVGVVLMVLSLVQNADDWVMKRNNAHIYQSGELVGAGTIYDKNNQELAKTVDGERVYHPNETVRKAVLHTVGDPYGFIATGVQTVYDTKLTGYNFVNGVYGVKNGGGNNITLTIDANVCAVALNALGGKKGTVGVYNYKTGEIICSVSSPTYDINNKPAADIIDSDPYYEGLYINRLFTGLYTPGSTFKVVVAMCAIENIPDVNTREFECIGYYQAGSGQVKCMSTHGRLDFKTALAKSCNSVFAQLASELGGSKINQCAESLGLTKQDKIDGIYTSIGKVDLADADPLQLGWAGVGQHTVMLTPVQMMRFMGAIANGGKAVSPYFVNNVKNKTTSLTGSSKALLESGTAAQLKEMLRYNTTSNYGDGNLQGFNLCAKSGTAEVDGRQPTSWFVGFLDSEAQPYAFVVVVEEGGSGSEIAGAVAKTVLQEIVKN